MNVRIIVPSGHKGFVGQASIVDLHIMHNVPLFNCVKHKGLPNPIDKEDERRVAGHVRRLSTAVEVDVPLTRGARLI